MVGVLVRLEIENQRRKSENAEGRRREGGAFQAMRGLLVQNLARRPCGRGQVIGHIVEKALNAGRRAQ